MKIVGYMLMVGGVPEPSTVYASLPTACDAAHERLDAAAPGDGVAVVEAVAFAGREHAPGMMHGSYTRTRGGIIALRESSAMRREVRAAERNARRVSRG